MQLASSPSKGKLPSNQPPPTQTLAIIFWMSIWYAASIGYVFSVAIIVRTFSPSSLMIDMYALSIAQTVMNTFLSGLVFLFIGRRVSLPSSTSGIVKNKRLNSIPLKQIDISISKGKVKESDLKNDHKKDNSPLIMKDVTTSRKNVHKEANKKDSKLLQIEIMEQGEESGNNLNELNEKNELKSYHHHQQQQNHHLDYIENEKNNNDNDIDKKSFLQDDPRTIDLWLSCTCAAGLKKWQKRTFYSDMLIIVVGMLRILVQLAGLLLLKFAQVSFAEAIKSTTPIFTVFFAYSILGEKASIMVQCSLIPVVAGLMLAAGAESALSVFGLISGLFNVSLEAMVNVFCKPLCAIYGGYETQFFTSVCSTFVGLLAIPFILESSFLSENIYGDTSQDQIILLLFSLICYHLQWSCQFILMELVSPITLSVTNVLKRGVMILVSLWYFRNPVTLPSGLGILVMFFGLITYTLVKRSESASSVISPNTSSTSSSSTHHIQTSSSLYKSTSLSSSSAD